MCRKCFEQEQIILEKKKQEGLDNATQFITDMIPYVEKAFARTTVFPALGKKSLIEQKDACDFVCRNIDNWKNYPFIKEALFETSVHESNGMITHPILKGMILRSSDTDIAKSFESLKKKADHLSTECYLASLKAYDYSKLFVVVGVTFKNGRRHRQTILRQIRFHDAPYSKTPEITLNRYLYENEDAVAVYANDEQIGNISRLDLPFLMEHWNEYSRVDDFDITGSTETNFGIVIRAVFVKNDLDESEFDDIE